MSYLRPYQTEIRDSVKRELANGSTSTLYVQPTGCHGAGTPILLASGHQVYVEDIVVGDKLMGPEGEIQTVTQLCRGGDELFTVNPVKGVNWIVNKNHILTLRRIRSRHADEECLVDVSLAEYLTWSDWQKHIHKLERFPVAEFEGIFAGGNDFTIDAYLCGVLLGDGCLTQEYPTVCTPDPEIRNHLESFAAHNGLTLSEYKSKDRCAAYYCAGRNGEYKKMIERAGLMGMAASNKCVPIWYKTASEANRKHLLAGLLDTDGSLNCNGYDFISKSAQLADDCAFLARSLGLAAYVSPCEKFNQDGVGGEYFRVSISGHTRQIPLKVQRKKASRRAQKKNVLRTGFSVESIGPGRYYGFSLSGSGRYLLGDFTCTHNTGKTEVALDIIDTWPDQKCNVLCLAHRQELIYQPWNRWHKKTGDYADMEMAEYNRSAGRSRVCFASKDSLHPNRLRKSYPDPRGVGLIWVDEAHHLAKDNKSYSHVLDYFLSANPDCRMFGCTATPDRTDEKALGQVFDSVAAEYPLLDPTGAPSAIGDGWLVPIEQEIVVVEEIEFAGVGSRGGDFIDGQLQKMLIENKAVEKLAIATREIAKGKTTLLFAAGIEQAILECMILNAEDDGTAYTIASRIPEELRFPWVINSQDKESRQRILKRWGRGDFPYFGNVGVFTEGMDEPRIQLISMGRPTKSRSLYAQMAGRGTRILPGIIEGDGWRLDTPEQRKEAIAKSGKPCVTILDFVGNSRHSLISTTDILGGKYEDEVVDEAKSRVASGERDVQKALEEAEQIVIERRKQVRAKAKITRRKVSPFDVLNVVARREPGWHKGRKPTKRQLEALKKFRLDDAEISDLSFSRAHDLLDGLIDRAKKKLCTYKQAKCLQRFGYDTDNMTFAQANQTMNQLARNGWKR